MMKATPAKDKDESEMSLMYEEGTLLALVESEAQAHEIAGLYGIALISVEEGLATFHTEQDLMELIELGRENDWPPVQPNYIRELF